MHSFSLGHYEQDAFTYAKWGVDCKEKIMELLYVPIVYRIDVKMDWCNTEFNGTKLDPHKQYAEMVTKMPLL